MPPPGDSQRTEGSSGPSIIRNRFKLRKNRSLSTERSAPSVPFEVERYSLSATSRLIGLCHRLQKRHENVVVYPFHVFRLYLVFAFEIFLYEQLDIAFEDIRLGLRTFCVGIPLGPISYDARPQSHGYDYHCLLWREREAGYGLKK